MHRILEKIKKWRVPFYCGKGNSGNRCEEPKQIRGTERNDCGGYFYASAPYVLYKTTSIMVHKNAVPKEIAKKMKLNN